ncbi:hypothetical protein [Sulfurimonas sp.]|uniref:hypothetical protein n=1 Tax=Sulfurimonas sp. TaxID=2022749 RepID=UPI0025FC5266|nr:hypothetical protein [Sulfurimonas sp.]
MKKLLIKILSISLLWLVRNNLNNAELMDSKGNFIKPFHPDCKSVDLEVVAIALSRIKRFFGQTNLSVAQHSVNMARVFMHFGNMEYAKQALLHEISEAFMGDLASPLKAAFPLFKSIEETLIKKTFSCYGLEYPMAQDVHFLDKQIMIYEALAHMPRKEYWLSLTHKEFTDKQIFSFKSIVDLDAWSEEKAFNEFMDTAKTLKLI